MKNSKNVLIIAMSIIFIVSFVVPVYAYTNYTEYIENEPIDIGIRISDYNALPSYDNIYHKYYLRITIENLTTADNIMYINTYYNDGNSEINEQIELFRIQNDQLTIYSYNNNEYSSILFPSINTYTLTENTSIFIPIFLYNRRITGIFNGIVSGSTYASMYYSTTVDQQTLLNQYYEVGYQNGYNSGYTVGIVDSAGYQQDLNLVEHCEQLLGTFVGDDYAHYISPLCLALVVILIYFLFIRWLLALVKSKNVTRVADIIVCTACIIMLVIMYAPMLDLTIHQAQTVYQITADTVVGG